MTIYIFYATESQQAKVLYKQGSAEQNMEQYEDVYLDIRNGQITIREQETQEPKISVPTSRTIVKYRNTFV